MSERDQKITVTGIGGMGWLLVTAIFVAWIFGGEIKCALGNKLECIRINTPETKAPDAQTP